MVDSTGLKIFGEGEWLQNKHNTRAKRKSWRKLHLGLDLVTGEIICADLTLDDVGDPTALPGLLDQIDGPVSRFLADGAYDGAPNSNLLKERFGDAVEIIIPPPKNAVPSPQSTYEPTQRDRHISEIHAQGRLAWQSSSGYNQRSRVETQIGRWKGVIGPKLKARSFENQKTEDRSQDRRHRSQRNDRPWPPRIRGGHVTMFKGKGAFRPLRDPCNNALTIRDHAFNTNLGIAASQAAGTARFISHDLGLVSSLCDRIYVMYAGEIVESGTRDEIFSMPRHPYTRGLIGSVPRLRNNSERLLTIPGRIPGPADEIEGCRFRPRCPMAEARCMVSPRLEASTRGHAAKCWLV